VGRQQVIQFSSLRKRASPKKVGVRYGIQANCNIPSHPDVLSAVAEHPRIRPVWLPTYAPWLNPIEKLWRWLRPDLLKMQRWVEDWSQVKQRVGLLGSVCAWLCRPSPLWGLEGERQAGHRYQYLVIALLPKLLVKIHEVETVQTLLSSCL